MQSHFNTSGVPIGKNRVKQSEIFTRRLYEKTDRVLYESMKKPIDSLPDL
jgi:hypothetical protein